MSRTSLFAIGITLSLGFAAAHGAEPKLPEAGPENGGLRLRLVVANHMDPNVHDLRLDLVNVGDRDVTLVAGIHYEPEPGESYADILRKSIVFTSTPEIIPSYFQTAGRERESSPPTTSIGKGDSLTIEWTVKGKSLSSFHTSQALNFPRNGLFFLRARTVVRDSAGHEIKLWSNEQPFLVGGSQSAPAACVAEITHSDDRASTATIDVGELDGIKKDDRFAVRVGMQGFWQMQITEVKRHSATVKISPKFARGRPPKFPTRGTKAAYQPAPRR